MRCPEDRHRYRGSVRRRGRNMPPDSSPMSSSQPLPSGSTKLLSSSYLRIYELSYLRLYGFYRKYDFTSMRRLARVGQQVMSPAIGGTSARYPSLSGTFSRAG